MRRSVAALVLTTGLALTACSSGDDTASDTETSGSSDSTSSPSQTAAESASGSASGFAESGDDVPAADVKGLALVAADFPAPYTFVELPPDALDQGAGAIGGALAGATFEPAECGAAAEAAQGVDLSQAGVAVGTDDASGSTVTSVVSPAVEGGPDLEALADTCSTFTFTLEAAGQAITGKASLEALPEPSVAADDARAARTTIDVTVAGQQQTVVTTIYTARLRGVDVVATGTGTPQAEIDDAVLEQLLTASVEKVTAY